MELKDLCDLIAELSDVSPDSIRNDSQLHHDLGLCSYEIMTLIAMIEAKTNKQINITELNGQITVGDLLAYIAP
ncbi:MAG: hypothetical protein K5695_04540 [Oscillospiraceae bacterium]|nr:hypothetical protein [Oscillospiraceae bacterium]